MTIKIDVRSDLAQVQRDLHLSQKEVSKAAVRALNKTATFAQSTATKAIAQAMDLKQTDIRKKLSIVKATLQSMRAMVTGSGKAIPLINFKARQVKDGVVIRFAGKRILYRGHFIATMPTGHKGVFFRKGGRREVRMSKHHVGKTYMTELPIVERFGPSIPHMLVDKNLTPAIYKAIKERWPVLFKHEIDYVLLKRRG